MRDSSVELHDAQSALKVSLGELLVFINWMQEAQRASNEGQGFPAVPDVQSEEVKSWARLIGNLQERGRQSENRQLALEANLQAQEYEVGRLLSHLHENVASLYENLGHADKAEDVRRRIASIQSA